ARRSAPGQPSAHGASSPPTAPQRQHGAASTPSTRAPQAGQTRCSQQAASPPSGSSGRGPVIAAIRSARKGRGLALGERGLPGDEAANGGAVVLSELGHRVLGDVVV